MPVEGRAFVSPTLVLLAFNWQSEVPESFVGFAIERSPGFSGAANSWLPNRIGFDGPPSNGGDLPSNTAPIQKFYWWDARIDTKDRGSSFVYRVIPVSKSDAGLSLMEEEQCRIEVKVPEVEEQSIGSYFNRAVVSSQAFSRAFPSLDTASQQKAARAWLANGMEQAVPKFFGSSGGKDVEGAIYHLTDEIWIVPAMRHYGGAISLVYNHHPKDTDSDLAIEELISAGRPESAFTKRTHTNIMHDKFLVRVGEADHAEAVLTGSANFTPEGLSVQANVIHTFESPPLARLYLDRKRLLDGDPSLLSTANAQKGWSDEINIGDAKVRVFFPPEPGSSRESLDAIIEAIGKAKKSVILCAFDPTDAALLDAVFKADERGLMMFALVNRIPSKRPTGDPDRSDVAAKISILDHYSKDHDVSGFDAFSKSDTPTGFAPERVLWPGEKPEILVRVHHKFVLVDPTLDDGLVFTGSANFSGNALHHNDENLLRIRCPRLCRMYLAEFMRLYEHYRARLVFHQRQDGDLTKFTLASDSSWMKKYFDSSDPAYRARMMLSGSSDR